ncbi:MAG: hypothetical protein KDA81_13940 [Planctomycetaceae bacterium]|nr:hypothetical protein [Planctomycetaceae bacterium]
MNTPLRDAGMAANQTCLRNATAPDFSRYSNFWRIIEPFGDTRNARHVNVRTANLIISQ